MSTRHTIQRDFSGGEISPRMLMRNDLQVYARSCLALRNFIPLATGGVARNQGTRYVRTIGDLDARIIPYRALDNKRNLVLLTPGELKMIEGSTLAAQPDIANYASSLAEIIYRKPIIENGDFRGGLGHWSTTTPKYTSNNGDGPLGTWWAPKSGNADGVCWLHPRLYKVASDAKVVDLSTTAVVDVPTDVLTIGYNLRFQSAVPFNSGYQVRIRIRAGTSLIYDVNLEDEEVGFIWDRKLSVPLPTPGWTGQLQVEIQVEALAYELDDVQEKWSTPKFLLDEFQIWANGITDITETDLVTPYTAEDLADIHYVQSPYDPKELVLVHPKHPPSRFYFDANGGQYVFEAIPFNNQPPSWAEDNYPSTCTSYLGRLVLAGGQDKVLGSPIAANSETVWCTKVGDWESFSLPEEVDPDDSMEFTAIYRSPIQWCHGHKSLLVGALEMEYIVSADGIFAPNDLGINLHSTHGGTHVQPAGIGEGVLFSADAGRRARKMTYDNGQQGWVAEDLTIWHPFLCAPGIKRMARLRNPHQMVLVLLNSGELVVYHQEEPIRGWSRIDITGGEIKDLCVLSDENGIDIPFVTVQRRIGGEDVLYLEAFPNWTNTSRWDYVYSSIVDADIAARPEPWIIPGLDHLNGQRVQVVGDDGYLGSFRVSNGQVELLDDIGSPFKPQVAIVGLAMFSQLITLPPDKVDPGSPARYSEFSVRVLGSTRPIINDQRPADRHPLNQMNRSEGLDIIGDYDVMTDSWNPYQAIVIEENVPLRCEILGVYGKLTANSL